MPSVAIVCDVLKVCDYRRMDFLVFTGNQHRSHAHQLVLIAFNHNTLGEAVNEVYSYEQGFWQEFKLDMYLHKPRQQKSSHSFSEFGLNLTDTIN